MWCVPLLHNIIENLTFLYTSCLACIESVDLNALAKYSTTESARRATWRQCHSRWINPPHTFDNSWLAKWELVNQIGRVHAPARWATRQEFLFGKKAIKCESAWRGGYNTHGQKEFVKPRKSGWNYGKFSNVRIDLYSNSLML